ncbi:hypothetical protein RYX36_030896 [Vicia faba]
MAGGLGFRSLAPKTRNFIVAGLTTFVFGLYLASGGNDELQVAIDQFKADRNWRAARGTDELQVAIDKFEADKTTKEGEASNPSKV